MLPARAPTRPADPERQDPGKDLALFGLVGRILTWMARNNRVAERQPASPIGDIALPSRHDRPWRAGTHAR